jgi:hypothetical protein
MKMILRGIIIVLLSALYFNLIELYRLGDPVDYIKKSEIVFEATDYDSTMEVFLVDLEGGQ